jgi:hypothetical protein
MFGRGTQYQVVDIAQLEHLIETVMKRQRAIIPGRPNVTYNITVNNYNFAPQQPQSYAALPDGGRFQIERTGSETIPDPFDFEAVDTYKFQDGLDRHLNALIKR